MKKLVCCILLLALNLPAAFAQGGFKERLARRPHPNPLLVGGIVTTSLGVCAAGIGYVIYALGGDMSKASPGQSRDNTGLYIAAVGGAMVVGGIVMICIGADQIHHKRFSLVSPKPNQVGVAFTLTRR